MLDANETFKTLSKFGPMFLIVCGFFALIYMQRVSHLGEIADQRVDNNVRITNQSKINSQRLDDQREAADARAKLYVELTSAQNKALTELYKRDHELYITILTSMSAKQNKLIEGQADIRARAYLLNPGHLEAVRTIITKEPKSQQNTQN